MRYRNLKTGIEFESKAECKGEDIELIGSSPTAPVKEEEKKPEKTKAPAKKKDTK